MESMPKFGVPNVDLTSHKVDEYTASLQRSDSQEILKEYFESIAAAADRYTLNSHHVQDVLILLT